MFNMYDSTRPYDNQMGYPDYLIERFWDKVDIEYNKDGTPNLEACMIWNASKDRFGHGTFNIKCHHISSHRFIYECYNGPIPKFNEFHERMCIRHKVCNNSSCVNPLHLKMGTYQQNADDMVEASRQAKGIEHGNSILTNEEVLEIKKLLDSYTHIKIIAETFNVSISQIYRIRNGDLWSHLTGIKNGDYEKRKNKNQKKLTSNQILEIKELINSGKKSILIAKKFSVSQTLISNIKNDPNYNK